MKRYKRTWEDLGEREAHYSVATHEKYRTSNLDEANLNDFYRSGREYLDQLWNDFEDSFGVVPKPKAAIDYGCGVGCVLCALAEDCESVVGVDIAQSMLDKTAKALTERGHTNFKLLSPDQLLAGTASYDFVHTIIVIQHINPKDGMKIIEKLIDSLEIGGMGMIHLTYRFTTSARSRFQIRLYNKFPALPALIRRFRESHSVWAPLYEYDLHEVFNLFQKKAVIK